VVSDVKKEQLTILRHGKIVETSFNNYGKEVGEILVDYFGLDSTRSKDVQARIDDLRNMIINDEYETAEFKQKFDELSDLVGAADEELTLMKIDINRRKYAKNQ
jgi:uracil phosphoribosyltransferase